MLALLYPGRETVSLSSQRIKELVVVYLEYMGKSVGSRFGQMVRNSQDW